jgi:hypothetical protein
MTIMGNEIQTLKDKLLVPFSAHNINLEIFFQELAEKVNQKVKEREAEEIRKRETEE